MSTGPRKLINPPEIHPTNGYFSHIAIGRGQKLVCVAGQVALAPDLSVVGEGDLAEQTRATMRNIGYALTAAGATWDDVVRRTIYTLYPTQFEAIHAAIEEVQGSTKHPAQTIIGVNALGMPELLIEIEVTAMVDG
jgi:enamine deaminase RidA (YjgF/YER057c/UK114 family)